jgi:hypothetical protein
MNQKRALHSIEWSRRVRFSVVARLLWKKKLTTEELQFLYELLVISAGSSSSIRKAGRPKLGASEDIFFMPVFHIVLVGWWFSGLGLGLFSIWKKLSLGEQGDE